MARLEGVSDEEAGLATRTIFKAARRMVGDVPEPMRIMARNPWVLRANVGFEFGLGKATALDARLKGLASVKAASIIGCLF